MIERVSCLLLLFKGWITDKRVLYVWFEIFWRRCGGGVGVSLFVLISGLICYLKYCCILNQKSVFGIIFDCMQNFIFILEVFDIHLERTLKLMSSICFSSIVFSVSLVFGFFFWSSLFLLFAKKHYWAVISKSTNWMYSMSVVCFFEIDKITVFNVYNIFLLK